MEWKNKNKALFKKIESLNVDLNDFPELKEIASKNGFKISWFLCGSDQGYLIYLNNELKANVYVNLNSKTYDLRLLSNDKNWEDEVNKIYAESVRIKNIEKIQHLKNIFKKG
ncbi:MAG: hypothetical protein ACP5RT_02150 [Candidatus Micrarchaeia archaeon]